MNYKRLTFYGVAVLCLLSAVYNYRLYTLTQEEIQVSSQAVGVVFYPETSKISKTHYIGVYRIPDGRLIEKNLSASQVATFKLDQQSQIGVSKHELYKYQEDFNFRWVFSLFAALFLVLTYHILFDKRDLYD